jgi:hypothetical protein
MLRMGVVIAPFLYTESFEYSKKMDVVYIGYILSAVWYFDRL